MPPIQGLLIKPAGPDCNIRCTYCFYACKQELFGDEAHRMDPSLLDETIAQYLALAGPQASIGFQGGEPTLCGLPFFEGMVASVAKHRQKGQQVGLALQTNGLLLDEDWAALLREHDILLGVSVDGPPDMHDHYRLRYDGTGTHARVLRNMQMLNRTGTAYNTLTVINQRNMGQAPALYAWLRENGSGYMQFIPCMEITGQGVAAYSLAPEAYGAFLCELFDLWMGKEDRPDCYIRLFDEMLIAFVEYTSPSCHLSTQCATNLVVEHNGDVYPCDFFVDPPWLLGNLRTTRMQDIAKHPLLERFCARKAVAQGPCVSCAYLPLCQGDCPKYRLGLDGRPSDVSYFCQAYQIFFPYAIDRLRALKRFVLSENPAWQRREAGLGRNSPCPCGSGKKYKACCGPIRGV